MLANTVSIDHRRGRGCETVAVSMLLTYLMILYISNFGQYESSHSQFQLNESVCTCSDPSEKYHKQKYIEYAYLQGHTFLWVE